MSLTRIVQTTLRYPGTGRLAAVVRVRDFASPFLERMAGMCS